MDHRPSGHKKSKKKVIIYGLIVIVLISLIASGLYFYFVYSEEAKCKDYTSEVIENAFGVNKNDFTLITSICNLNNPIDVKQRVDTEILNKNNKNVVHLIDRIDNCYQDGCDHTLCIGSEKKDELYVKLTDFVCNNRVLESGGPTGIALELQRKECYNYFEKQNESRTVFSAFFPKGVGVIKLEKGSLDC